MQMDRFYIKGTWSVHLFNGDYLSIPEGTGSCVYLFHEIPGSQILGTQIDRWIQGSIFVQIDR